MGINTGFLCPPPTVLDLNKPNGQSPVGELASGLHPTLDCILEGEDYVSLPAAKVAQEVAPSSDDWGPGLTTFESEAGYLLSKPLRGDENHLALRDDLVESRLIEVACNSGPGTGNQVQDRVEASRFGKAGFGGHLDVCGVGT